MIRLLAPLLLAVAFVGLSIAVAFGVRRRNGPEQLTQIQAPAGSTFMAATAGLFGVLVAFVLNVALSRFDSAQEVISRETSFLEELSVVAAEFPPQLRDEVRAACAAYFRGLSNESSGSLIDERTQAALERLQTSVATFKPSDEGATNAHSAALGAVNQLSAQRRTRLMLSRQSMPWPVWGVLLFGGLFAMLLCAFAQIRPLALHLGFVGGLAVLIASALLTIYVVERPFGVGFKTWYPKYEDIVRAAPPRPKVASEPRSRVES